MLEKHESGYSLTLQMAVSMAYWVWPKADSLDSELQLHTEVPMPALTLIAMRTMKDTLRTMQCR